jgi:exodeoxyribonuclease V alpha subunit
MRGGLERWKRGERARGVRQAIGYALEGNCDSHLRAGAAADVLAAYSDVDSTLITRFVCAQGRTGQDKLDETSLRRWVSGEDPLTGDVRGVPRLTPNADLLLDGTINAPKTYSLAAVLHPELETEFEALQDRLRDRIIRIWQSELNARRGHGGAIREDLARIEVVELKHRRSRALDPHIHRHLWLNAKVLGQDGKWSTVDSRVAMRLHTVVNAEGEVAARTDPTWIAALSRHGYDLDDEGEIAQLAHAVRPLSRRSTQIEGHRATLMQEWRDKHPGQHPSHDIMQQIDRRSWALSRPGKPAEIDEGVWEHTVRGELFAIDQALLEPRRPITPSAVAVGMLDRDELAAKAVVDADRRSPSTGGRFSAFDIRAGVLRAIAASGVVQERALLQELVDDVVERACAMTVDLLSRELSRPAHVKAYMAAETAALKVDLGTRLDALNEAGAPLDRALTTLIAAATIAPNNQIDPGQLDAAAAMAGTDRLVTITGPAGTGKTTVLMITERALRHQGRRMVVVAPTRKAATIAAREIGAASTSLHSLLADYGWRWQQDHTGQERWTRLRPGEIDAVTGRSYLQPTIHRLQPGDRIVVDEAGMVDLHAATALAEIATETGAGIAMVGDHLQATPVGHSGAMATMVRRSGAVVELTAVHRFRDPTYAALTLRLREPESKDAALSVAHELVERGHTRRVASEDAAREAMTEAWFRWAAHRKRVALVTATNDQADAVNQAIQQCRLERGQLTSKRVAVGRDDQRLLEGDVVQTRRNDRNVGVDNRALWTLSRITTEHLELVSLSDSSDRRRVTAEYAAEHVALAYASTVHGIQGETTDASVVGPGVDAAGLYVGLTRGRHANEALVIATTDAAARETLASAMLRGIPEVTIADAIEAARAELRRAAQAVRPTLAQDAASSAPMVPYGPTAGGSSLSR